MKRRACQAQAYIDAQYRRRFGEQALFNYASYIDHAARHGDTWTMDMLKYWKLDYHEMPGYYAHAATGRRTGPLQQESHRSAS